MSSANEVETESTTQTKQVGRPAKRDVDSKKKGNRKQVGRPKGDAAALNEFKARILNSPKSRKVIKSIFDAALDDEHKNQAVAWKLIMDRIAPTGLFDNSANKGPGGVKISIEVVGDGKVSVNEEPEEAVEGEFEEMTDE